MGAKTVERGYKIFFLKINLLRKRKWRKPSSDSEPQTTQRNQVGQPPNKTSSNPKKTCTRLSPFPHTASRAMNELDSEVPANHGMNPTPFIFFFSGLSVVFYKVDQTRRTQFKQTPKTGSCQLWHRNSFQRCDTSSWWVTRARICRRPNPHTSKAIEKNPNLVNRSSTHLRLLRRFSNYPNEHFRNNRISLLSRRRFESLNSD